MLKQQQQKCWQGMGPENLALDHSHSRCPLGTVYTAQTYMGKCHLPPPGLGGVVSKIIAPPQTTIWSAWCKLLLFLECSTAMCLCPNLLFGPMKSAAGQSSGQQSSCLLSEQKSSQHSSENLLVTKHMHNAEQSLPHSWTPPFLLPPNRVCSSRSTYFKYRCIMNQLELYNDQTGRTFQSII